jgi:hydrogenase nickel incorporation protein HypA/HybF
VETPDPVYQCLDCGKVSVIPFALPGDRLESLLSSHYPKKCPWCCLSRLSPKGGTELILNQVEME